MHIGAQLSTLPAEDQQQVQLALQPTPAGVQVVAMVASELRLLRQQPIDECTKPRLVALRLSPELGHDSLELMN